MKAVEGIDHLPELVSQGGEQAGERADGLKRLLGQVCGLGSRTSWLAWAANTVSRLGRRLGVHGVALASEDSP